MTPYNPANKKFPDSPSRYNKNINDFRFIICTNKTSAAVDFYRQGYKIITIKDFNEFNLSPLKDYEECLFVSNSKEIDDYLNRNYEHIGLRHKNDKFYLINIISIKNGT